MTIALIMIMLFITMATKTKPVVAYSAPEGVQGIITTLIFWITDQLRYAAHRLRPPVGTRKTNNTVKKGGSSLHSCIWWLEERFKSAFSSISVLWMRVIKSSSFLYQTQRQACSTAVIPAWGKFQVVDTRLLAEIEALHGHTCTYSAAEQPRIARSVKCLGLEIPGFDSQRNIFLVIISRLIHSLLSLSGLSTVPACTNSALWSIILCDLDPVQIFSCSICFYLLCILLHVSVDNYKMNSTKKC